MSVKIIQFKHFDSIQLKETKFKEFDLPDHFHDEYCIGFLSSGLKSYVVEGSPYLIHSNAVSIVNPYQIHSDKNYGSDICHYKMIYINREVLNYFAKKINGHHNNTISFTNDLIVDPSVSTALLEFFNFVNEKIDLENKLHA